jgi:MtN3 and saliva related transmembrane protein
MEFIDIFGLVAGLCTSAASVPQIVKTIKEKKAQDVSPVMFIVLLTGNILWTYYGFHKSDFPIIATNVLAIILDIVMLILRGKYKNNTA